MNIWNFWIFIIAVLFWLLFIRNPRTIKKTFFNKNEIEINDFQTTNIKHSGISWWNYHSQQQKLNVCQGFGVIKPHLHRFHGKCCEVFYPSPHQLTPASQDKESSILVELRAKGLFRPFQNDRSGLEDTLVKRSPSGVLYRLLHVTSPNHEKREIPVDSDPDMYSY